MALRFISPSDVDNSEDLPWVNEYVKEHGQPGDSSLVRKIVLGDKGYLVIAQAFKGFIFLRSTMAKYLSEALDVWVTNNTVNYPLFAIANKNGKLELAIDDELESSQWLKDKNTWEQRLKKTQGSGYTGEIYNPLLPNSPPTTTNGRKAKQTATPSNPIT